MMQTADLSKAYAGSYYTICGAGGHLDDWEKGVGEVLESAGIGRPVAWFQTTGADINAYAATKGEVTDPFKDDLTVIMFPLDGLTSGLAGFRLVAGDHWFDDLVNNMIVWPEDEEDGE